LFVMRQTKNGREVALTHWRFNAWAKYDDWRRDQKLPPFIAGALDLPLFPALGPQGRHMVLEGGSIDVNGQGLLLTTEECLLSPIQERNPGLGRTELERLFAEYLVVR